MRLFIFGVGYSSKAFVNHMRRRCAWIGGTTRSHEKARSLSQLGVEPFIFNGEEAGEGVANALRAASHVLISIAPNETNDPVLEHHGAHIAAAKPDWIGYLSTVGVYGDHDGAWVNEDTPCRPVSNRSLQRRAAEEAWLNFSQTHELPVQIFRLSGIYGPGRNALEKLKSRKAKRLIKQGQVFNRIHVEDIAGSLERAMSAPSTRIFNVTDDEPAPPQDVISFAADLLGVEPPPEAPFETADIFPMARSFYGENKRVSNARLRQELGYEMKYPNYRIALTEIRSNEKKATNKP